MGHFFLGAHHVERKGTEKTGCRDESRKIVRSLERFGEHRVRDHRKYGSRRRGGGGRPRFV